MAFDVALTAGRFYKIYVGTKDSAKVLYYPVVPDDAIVENDYFSISRDNASDYYWSTSTIRYGGYVTITTA